MIVNDTESTITIPTDESYQQVSSIQVFFPRRLQDENKSQDSVKTDLASQLEQQMKQRQSKITIVLCHMGGLDLLQGSSPYGELRDRPRDLNGIN